MSDELRSRTRIDLSRLAFAKDGKEARGGLLKNISASGCALQFANPIGKVDHPFKVGQKLELEIADIGNLQGEVMRVTEKSIALKFISGTTESDALIAWIMAAQNEIEISE